MKIDPLVRNMLTAMLRTNLEGAADMLRIGNLEMLRVELRNALAKADQLDALASADSPAPQAALPITVDV